MTDSSHRASRGPSPGPSRRGVLATGFGGAALTTAAVATGAGALSAAQANPVAGDLTWRSAADIAADVRAGVVSPEAVTRHFLARIEALDRKIHAFRTIDADGALAQARALDVTADLPLAGVPVAVKQTLAVKGWPQLGPDGREQIAQADDLAVVRLRAAGAILVGSTIADSLEDAFISGRGATVINPWSAGRAAGASSAGSAAAVASAMIPLAVGVDGAGGARLPAAQCGVVAMAMPQLEADRGQVLAAAALLGRDPFASDAAPTLTSVGAVAPIARDVGDAVLLMSVLTGVTQPAVSGDSVRGLKFGWSDGLGHDADGLVAVVRQTAAGRFEALGASVHDAGPLVRDGWASDPLTQRIGGAMPPARASADDLLADGARRQAAYEAMAALFQRFDLLLMPTTPFAAQPAGTRHRGRAAPAYAGNTHLASWLGLPAVSVPAGLHDGLPAGLQLVARSGNEALLLRAAEAFVAAAPATARPILS